MKSRLFVPVALISFLISCWSYDAFIDHWYGTPREKFDVDRFEAFFRAQTNAPLVIGSSRTSAYIPWMLSSNAMVLNIGALPVEILATFLERLKNTRPDHVGPVIIDLGEGAYRSGLSKTYTTDLDFIIRFPEIRELLHRKNALHWVYEFPGLRYFGGALNVFDNVARRIRFDLWPEGNRGYPHWVVNIPNEFDPKVGPPPVTTDLPALREFIARRQTYKTHIPDPPNESEVAALEHALTNLAPRRVVVARVPVHPSYQVLLEPIQGDMKRIMSRLSKLPGVVVLDYSSVKFGDECYRDEFHLNLYGSYLYTRQLIADMNRAGVVLHH